MCPRVEGLLQRLGGVSGVGHEHVRARETIAEKIGLLDGREIVGLVT